MDDELKPESFINFSLGYDSDENNDYSLLLDYEFSEFQHLGFYYAKNSSPTSSSSTRSYILSASTSSYEKFSIDANISFIEIPDTLETRSLSNAFNLNLVNWHFSVGPKLSVLTFFLDDRRQNKFNIDAKGAELAISYFGFEKLYFSGNYFKNTFSKKPIFLEASVFNSLATNTMQKIRIISQINNIASNLEEQRISLTVGRYANWGNFDFTWSYVELFNVAQWLDFAVLAPLQETTYINSFSSSASYDINKNVNLGMILGMQTLSSKNDKLFFTSISTGYRW